MGREGGRGPWLLADVRTALVVAVIAGTGLSALLLRSDYSFGRGRGAVTDDTLTVLLALAWAGGYLLLYRWHRRRIAVNTRLDPVEKRLTDAVRTVLLVAAVVVPALVVGMHRLHTHHTASRRHHVKPPNSGGGGTSNGSDQSPTWFFLLVVTVVLLVAVFIYVVVVLRRQPVEEQQVPLPDSGEETRRLADAVESGRRALLGATDARAAVIACYAAMEASLAASGVARRASDSPQDFLQRAIGSGLLTGDGALVLTDLFREARYSTHPMDGAHRDRAAAALDEIAGLLGAPRFSVRQEVVR